MSAIHPPVRSSLLEDYEFVHAQMLELARVDFQAFVEYVMRDEHTNEPVIMQPFQREWWRLTERYDRCLILAFMESGKSFLLSIALTLWELGRDPSLQFAIISRTSRQAKKLTLSLARYLEESVELKEVFPWLKRDQRMPWNSEQLTVQRPGISKDPSIQVVSIGKTVHGARIDRAVLDDVLDRENTRTPERREDSWEWYQASIPGRLTATSRVRAVGNAFHKEDLHHRLARNERWYAYRFPLLRPNGQSAWPGRWPLARCAQRRAELQEVKWKIQMQCEPIDLEIMGMMFARHEVVIVDNMRDLYDGGPEPKWVRRWDLAASVPSESNPDPDWTCGVKMGRTKSGKFAIPNVIFARKRSGAVRRLIRSTAELDGKRCEVGIPEDPAQAGKDQVASYKAMLAGFRMWADRESGDKIIRAEPLSAQWQGGNVILLRAPWNEQYLSFMEAFPAVGFHDDPVDASSGAFKRVLERRDIFAQFKKG